MLVWTQEVLVDDDQYRDRVHKQSEFMLLCLQKKLSQICQKAFFIDQQIVMSYYLND